MSAPDHSAVEAALAASQAAVTAYEQAVAAGVTASAQALTASQNQLTILQAQLATALADDQADTNTITAQAANLAAQSQQIAALQAQLAAYQNAQVRPSGSVVFGGQTLPYVAIESIYKTGDKLSALAARLTQPSVLTWPVGHFDWADFAQGYQTCIDIPHGPSGGTNGPIVGNVGSGVGDSTHTKDGSYFGIVPNSAKVTGNNLLIMKSADAAGMILGQLRVCGTEQGRLFSGAQIYHPTAPWHVYDAVVDGWSGNANVPPGETTGWSAVDIDPNKVMAHLFQRIECDARRPDGKRYGAAPMGGQNQNGATWEDCYAHHAVASSFGWSQSRNVHVIRPRSEYNGTGGGTLSGSCMNFENTDGFVIDDPSFILDRSNGNTGVHVSHSNYKSAAYPDPTVWGKGTLTINRAKANDGMGTGKFQMQAFGYSVMANTSTPSVTPNPVTPDGKTLTPDYSHP